MMKSKISLWATAGLLVVAAIAYLGPRWMSTVPPAVSLTDSGKSDTGAKSVRGATDAKSDKGPDKAGAAGGPTPVEVIELRPTAVQEDLTAVGSLRSNESVLLRPEVAGRIDRIGFRDGQAVRRGQLLVGLDASVNQAEVAQARAEYELAQSNLKRTEDLARKNFVSSSAQEQSASNVQVSEAKLKLAEARLAKMQILAPFDGVVGIRNISVGDYVKDGTDLVNIEDVGVLKADFRLPERYFTQIRVGQPVEVMADAVPGERFRGVIDAINPRIDANGRSVEVRARLSNQERKLRPGMFMRMRVIIGERANALVVPEEAIVPLGEDFFVFRVDNGAARRVKVKVGVRRDAKVEILEGLGAGDLVVTAGMRLARDGQAVKIVGGRESSVGSKDLAAETGKK
jgi:membrane fusion protein (multidrug efflux system)